MNTRQLEFLRLVVNRGSFAKAAESANTMLPTLLAGVDMSGNGQAMDPIREVGPGELPSVRTQVPTASGRFGKIPIKNRRATLTRRMAARKLRTLSKCHPSGWEQQLQHEKMVAGSQSMRKQCRVFCRGFIAIDTLAVSALSTFTVR